MIADVAGKRALGDNAGADAAQDLFWKTMSPREIYMQTCYDLVMVGSAFRNSGIFSKK
jgi:hypothetical protein